MNSPARLRPIDGCPSRSFGEVEPVCRPFGNLNGEGVSNEPASVPFVHVVGANSPTDFRNIRGHPLRNGNLVQFRFETIPQLKPADGGLQMMRKRRTEWLACFLHNFKYKTD